MYSYWMEFMLAIGWIDWSENFISWNLQELGSLSNCLAFTVFEINKWSISVKQSRAKLGHEIPMKSAYFSSLFFKVLELVETWRGEAIKYFQQELFFFKFKELVERFKRFFLRFPRFFKDLELVESWRGVVITIANSNFSFLRL